MLSLLAKLPDNCHPMDVVRTAISYRRCAGPDETTSATTPRAAGLAGFCVTDDLPAGVAVWPRGEPGSALRNNTSGGRFGGVLRH